MSNQKAALEADIEAAAVPRCLHGSSVPGWQLGRDFSKLDKEASSEQFLGTMSNKFYL